MQEITYIFINPHFRHINQYSNLKSFEIDVKQPQKVVYSKILIVFMILREKKPFKKLEARIRILHAILSGLNFFLAGFCSH
jgi:hypothetical protein